MIIILVTNHKNRTRRFGKTFNELHGAAYVFISRQRQSLFGDGKSTLLQSDYFVD